VQQYQIQAIPTLILFRDGEEKERIIGAASKQTIALALDKHLNAVLN
jgi:thioredoxin-like negative regulator of GroEL